MKSHIIYITLLTLSFLTPPQTLKSLAPQNNISILNPFFRINFKRNNSLKKLPSIQEQELRTVELYQFFIKTLYKIEEDKSKLPKIIIKKIPNTLRTTKIFFLKNNRITKSQTGITDLHTYIDPAWKSLMYDLYFGQTQTKMKQDFIIIFSFLYQHFPRMYYSLNPKKKVDFKRHFDSLFMATLTIFHLTKQGEYGFYNQNNCSFSSICDHIALPLIAQSQHYTHYILSELKKDEKQTKNKQWHLKDISTQMKKRYHHIKDHYHGTVYLQKEWKVSLHKDKKTFYSKKFFSLLMIVFICTNFIIFISNPYSEKILLITLSTTALFTSIFAINTLTTHLRKKRFKNGYTLVGQTLLFITVLIISTFFVLYLKNDPIAFYIALALILIKIYYTIGFFFCYFILFFKNFKNKCDRFYKKTFSQYQVSKKLKTKRYLWKSKKYIIKNFKINSITLSILGVLALIAIIFTFCGLTLNSAIINHLIPTIVKDLSLVYITLILGSIIFIITGSIYIVKKIIKKIYWLKIRTHSLFYKSKSENKFTSTSCGVALFIFMFTTLSLIMVLLISTWINNTPFILTKIIVFTLFSFYFVYFIALFIYFKVALIYRLKKKGKISPLIAIILSTFLLGLVLSIVLFIPLNHFHIFNIIDPTLRFSGNSLNEYGYFAMTGSIVWSLLFALLGLICGIYYLIKDETFFKKESSVEEKRNTTKTQRITTLKTSIAQSIRLILALIANLIILTIKWGYHRLSEKIERSKRIRKKTSDIKQHLKEENTCTPLLKKRRKQVLKDEFFKFDEIKLNPIFDKNEKTDPIDTETTFKKTVNRVILKSTPSPLLFKKRRTKILNDDFFKFNEIKLNPIFDDDENKNIRLDVIIHSPLKHPHQQYKLSA